MTAKRHRSAGAKEIGGLDAVAALRHGRRIARLSQRDLARIAGVSQSLVARIEARRVDPPVGVLQRLLGCCGLRWELRLVVAGDTEKQAGNRRVAVQQSARRRFDSAYTRRAAENAVARETAVLLADAPLGVREKRRRIKAARLAERTAQAKAYAISVNEEDMRARRWRRSDAGAAARQFRRHLEHCRIPLAERLPGRIHPSGTDDFRRLLEALAASWPNPPVALSGGTAHAVWSPGRRRGPSTAIEVTALKTAGPGPVVFLTALGARPRGGNQVFDLGRLAIRLREPAPLSTTLVFWRPGRPERAIAVARPETSLRVPVDRHAVRAVLEWAGRDIRGRRRAPYHEALEVAPHPWWLGLA